MIDQSVKLFGNRYAFEIKHNDEFKYITYKEYDKKISGFSTAIIDAGLENCQIAICADNCFEYCLTYLSTICAGATVVPIDKELHEDDIANIIEVSESKMLVCDTRFLSRVDIGRFSDVRILCIHKPEDCAFDVESFEEFVERGIRMNEEGRTLYRNVIQDVDKMCTLLFTSGTTGSSKGVMLCQRNYIFEIKAAMGVLKIHPEDCGISLLPLHHTFESSIIVFFAVYCGAKVTFCEGFKYVLRNMKDFNPTVFVAVPLILETVHKRILKEIEKKKFGKTKFKIGKALCKGASRLNIDLKKVIFKEIQETFGGHMRLIICGGAPINPQIIKDFDSFGIQVLFGYGLTECAPLVMINHDRLRTTDSVGQPLPGSEAKILNPDENGIGELCTRGGMVMLGYYKNPEATAEVLDSDGWFHTGDLAFVDKRGCYHITGRCKNVIVTNNGKNIYPEELEYHLDLSDFVESCMVEGLEDGRGDIMVHAQIHPNKEEIKGFLDKDPTSDEIKAIIKRVVDEVNNVVPGFKRIKSFSVRDSEFELTTTKKIKRGNASNKTNKNAS